MQRDVRESLCVLPRVWQPFFTWVTGVPYADQRPWIWWTPITYTLFYVGGILIAGLAVGVAALALPWAARIPLLIASWILTTSAVRELDVVIIHICVHRKMFKSANANRYFAECLSTILWRMCYDDNWRIHVAGHHNEPCTEDDDDVKFLRWTGFRENFSKREFLRYLGRTVCSPSFYFAAFAARVKANFRPHVPRYRRVMAIGYLVVLGVFLSVSGWWIQWLVLWVFPVVVLLQTSALLSTLSEHRWWLYRDGQKLTNERLARLTFARFCGDPIPTGAEGTGVQRFVRWTVWWTRVFLVHVPYRLFVLVGDLSQHDIHHRSGRFNMVNASYLRRDDLKDGVRGWPGYYEVWGGMLTHMYAAMNLQHGRLNGESLIRHSRAPLHPAH